MKITEINAIDQEVIEREMTDIELAQYEIDQENLALLKLEAKAKAEAKAKLFERLGITEDEAKLLFA